MPVLVVVFPHFLQVAKRLGVERSIYYCVDNYQAYWPDRKDRMVAHENELIESCRATICTSAALAELFRGRVPAVAERIYHLPNGVHSEMIRPLSDALTGPASAPEDISRLPRPLVGFYGDIGAGSGLSLINELADILQDFSFVMVGEIKNNQDPTFERTLDFSKMRSNVHFIGPRPEPDSRRYLWSCDALLITHPLDEQRQYSCPNKWWSYLASGRPIVSTPIPEIVSWGKVVHIGRSAEDFRNKLQLCVRNEADEQVEVRLNIATTHTWQAISNRLWDLLSKPL